MKIIALFDVFKNSGSKLRAVLHFGHTSVLSKMILERSRVGFNLYTVESVEFCNFSGISVPEITNDNTALLDQTRLTIAFGERLCHVDHRYPYQYLLMCLLQDALSEPERIVSNASVSLSVLREFIITDRNVRPYICTNY